MQEEGLRPGPDYTIASTDPDGVAPLLAQARSSIMFIKPVECKVGSSPTKFGESLAAGVPVIVNSGIGDTEEIIRRNRVGVVVDDLSEIGYEKAAEELMGLLGEGEALRRRCVSVAERSFSLDLGIARYAGVYERIG